MRSSRSTPRGSPAGGSTATRTGIEGGVPRESGEVVLLRLFRGKMLGVTRSFARIIGTPGGASALRRSLKAEGELASTQAAVEAVLQVAAGNSPPAHTASPLLVRSGPAALRALSRRRVRLGILSLAASAGTCGLGACGHWTGAAVCAAVAGVSGALTCAAHRERAWIHRLDLLAQLDTPGLPLQQGTTGRTLPGAETIPAD